MSAEERRRVSYHEAGHAIVSMALGEGDQDRVELFPPDRPDLIAVHRRARVFRNRNMDLHGMLDALTDSMVSAAGWATEAVLAKKKGVSGDYQYDDGGMAWDVFWDSGEIGEDHDDQNRTKAALAHVAGVVGRSGFTRAMEREWETCVEAMIERPEIWSAISTLAADLNRDGIVEELGRYWRNPPLLLQLPLAHRWASRFAPHSPSAAEARKQLEQWPWDGKPPWKR